MMHFADFSVQQPAAEQRAESVIVTTTRGAMLNSKVHSTRRQIDWYAPAVGRAPT